jgi:hypothetical protein
MRSFKLFDDGGSSYVAIVEELLTAQQWELLFCHHHLGTSKFLAILTYI